MTATKGPIERIRESVNYLASRMSTPQIESVADDVREACDELYAYERAYVERHPQVWMMTTDQSETVLNAIMECLRIIGHSEGDGAALEKIATEWMASRQASTPQPDRIDNGDGTVTFPSVPVTVLAAIIKDGSTVLRVGVPKPGDRCVVAYGTKSRICTDEKWLSNEYRIILSAPPAPQFRAGGYYRTRSGEVVGPLEPNTAQEAADVKTWPWQVRFSGGVITYTERGTVWSKDASQNDLRPGEVTVWEKPPVSLKADDYVWDGFGLHCNGIEAVTSVGITVLADWTDPPKPGRYKVPGGGKIATWEGDAP